MTYKTLQNYTYYLQIAVSKFELPEIQFKMTVMDKIVCKTHLEWENDCFEHISGILFKFRL